MPSNTVLEMESRFATGNEQAHHVLDEIDVWCDPDNGPGGYVLVQWPESQKYMSEECFLEDAYLDITDQYGDGAVWIPEEWIDEEIKDETKRSKNAH